MPEPTIGQLEPLVDAAMTLALALVVAAKNPGLVDAVVSASPGEYFGELGLLIGEHTRSADAVAGSDGLLGLDQRFKGPVAGVTLAFRASNRQQLSF